jgi:biotin synthase-like enzyme
MPVFQEAGFFPSRETMKPVTHNESAAVAADKTWSARQVAALFDAPFNDLIHRAHGVHRSHFDPNAVQLSTLLSVKS